MDVSIIIPLWQGEETIADCLQAVAANSDGFHCEVLCVDNNSSDDSAAMVAERFPHVTLLRQPVNLGFAGGVNVGLAAAKGELMVLLNQDCLVMPGWLTVLVDALQERPNCGIAGCTILNADGTVNHAGARLTLPSAYGVHRTEIIANAPHVVDYVTGAVFAIRRTTWDAIGPLDEDFYPAYYEETDYCYRTRRHGHEILYVPGARARHLFTGHSWQRDPVKHAANQHQSRFRFVCKHFQDVQLHAFFAAEQTDIEAEVYVEQLIGRAQGARHTLRVLPDILARRQQDLHTQLSNAATRQLQVGFAAIWRLAIAKAQALAVGQQTGTDDAKSLFDARRGRVEARLQELNGVRAETRRLLQAQEELLARIYFHTPTVPPADESTWDRLVRLVFKRPASILSGRDYLLRARLAVLQSMVLAEQAQTERILHELMELSLVQMEHVIEEQRLLKLLADYEYR